MKWEIGDRLRVIDAARIIGEGIENGSIYDVVYVNDNGTPEVNVGEDASLCFYETEMQYVERVTYGEEDTERNAELGEPSEGCNCETLADIYEELTDIKAMIGRLLRNGGETE